MVITYDPRYNTAYIRFREPKEQIESVPIGTELVVDVTADDKICGIELLNANELLKLEKGLTIVIVNEATGERAVFPLDP